MRIALLMISCYFLLVSWNVPLFFPLSMHAWIEKSLPAKPSERILDVQYLSQASIDEEEFNPVIQQPPPAKKEENKKTFTYQIVLDPKKRTLFSSEINASVVKIYKRMGDSFEAGDILIALDDRVAKGIYEKALAKESKAFIELEGKRQLYRDNLISFFEVKDAEAAFADAHSDFVTAEKALFSTKIIAPYRGKVVRLAIQEFEYAQVGKELLETVEDDILHGRFLASASILPCLKAGKTELLIEINGNKHKRKAIITRLSPVIDPASATIQVEADIDNRDRLWLPGMAGHVMIECPVKKREEL